MSEITVTDNAAETIQPTYLKDYRVPAFFIDEIDLTIDLHPERTLVKSLMRVRRNRHCGYTAKQFVLDGEELILEEIKLDDKILKDNEYHINENSLTIDNPPDNFILEITVKISPKNNTALSGLYLSNGKYCTQCEAEGFRRITYFMDHPDVLSRFKTTIIADEKDYPYLLSNGNLIESGKIGEGKHWAKWEDPFKKPSYLFAMVAGDFDVIEDKFMTQSAREIIIRMFVEKGYADQAQHAIDSAKLAMRWDETAYGREYDLDVYMLVAINDFNMGAMENKGLNIFNTKYALAKPETATDDDFMHILSVVGHEYFHNWSGNRVTCRDWFQLSLKEGLTIFRDQSFSEDTLSKAVMRIRDVNVLRESQFPEDAGPLAHPVRPESYIEINNFYTSTIYNKGAEVLRMLQTILGANMFRKGMDLYFARHDGQAVTIEDFVRTMEDVSGVDLTQFRIWYSQAGTPLVKVEDDYDAQTKLYTLRISQSCPPTPNQPHKVPLHIPIRIGLLDQEGGEIPLIMGSEKAVTETVLHLKEASQTFQFKEVHSQPIPSLLRSFSAPVKLHYPYSDADLLFLCKHDKDDFNRWDAQQKYLLRIILGLIRDYQNDKPLDFPEEVAHLFEHLLNENHLDKLFIAEMLTLPSEIYIGEQLDVVDVDAIHAVREFLLNELAQKLAPIFLKVYNENHDQRRAEFNVDTVGKRQLKNRCLYYLVRTTKHIELAKNQFSQAITSNMTDTQATLAAIMQLDTPFKAEALQSFYDAWQKDSLVLDKWFALQAASPLPHALAEVKKLMRHEAFDIKNPNKVYALIGTFGHRNLVNFHAENGEGYAFLRETVKQLDKLNPQVAARMVKPLTKWRRYDKERQALMQEQLELLLQDKKISKDLYEIVTKSLE